MNRLSVYGLIFLLVLALVLAGLAWQEAANAWPSNEDKTLFKTMLYYQSLLMPFFLVWVIWGFKHQQVSTGFMLVTVVGAVFGIYARFVEPNLLIVKESHIKTGYKLKIALISDMHYGLYSTPQQMQRLVDKLNTLDVDAIVVAGDWTYEPSQKIDLAKQLAPFSQLKKPIYSVMGNHDEEQPGPPLTQALKQALIANNIKVIDRDFVNLGQVILVGSYQVRYLLNVDATDKPLLVLMHTPDSVHYFPKKNTRKLVALAGHTHGGQINLPILTKKILLLATREGYQRGLYTLPQNNQLFVTSGIGMIGLPLRFAMPPTIDVLVFE